MTSSSPAAAKELLENDATLVSASQGARRTSHREDRITHIDDGLYSATHPRLPWHGRVKPSRKNRHGFLGERPGSHQATSKTRPVTCRSPRGETLTTFRLSLRRILKT